MSLLRGLFIGLIFINIQNLSQQLAVQDQIPKISLKDLQNNLNNPKIDAKYFDTLRDSGGKFSAIVVSDVADEYSQALRKFQSRAPSCVKGLGKNEIFKLPLNENSHRITFATITKSFPDCLDHDIISEKFDEVDALITKLIEVLTKQELDYEVNGDIFNLFEAPTKDHVHVYFNNITSHGKQANQKRGIKSSRSDKFMVPFHVDNGLYLLITPFSNHGLQIELSNGEVVSTSDVDSDSIIILFGRGLTDWMLQDSDQCRTNFFPAPHAVPSFVSSKISYRSVYARMKVAPYDAIPHNDRNISEKELSVIKSFGDVFTETELPNSHTYNKPSIRQHHASQLCSTELQNSFSPSKSSRWKRNGDSWNKKMKDQCDDGQAFCWMNCLPLPSECPSEEASQCINDKNEPCSDDSMDPSCNWYCKPTTIAPPSNTPTNTQYTTQSPEDPFCRSGSFSTDMNMKGFFSTGMDKKPCIILFFKAWELDSRLKFAFGCIGVIILGMMVEACIAIRRKLGSPSKRRFVRLLRSKPSIQFILSFLLFGVNLGLGYMAMLVAMTYSLELFLCVVLGIMIGHAIFNMKQPVGESIDPCCAPSQNNESKPIESMDKHDGRQGRN